MNKITKTCEGEKEQLLLTIFFKKLYHIEKDRNFRRYYAIFSKLGVSINLEAMWGIWFLTSIKAYQLNKSLHF